MSILDKLAELGFSWPTLLAQIIAFVFLLIILTLFAYKPIIRMFDERARKIKESIQEVQKVKEQAVLAEEEFKKKIESASREGQEVIARAMRTGEEARQKAQQEAKQEAQVLVEKARVEIQRERNEVVTELRQEFADLAVAAAEKVIEKTLDKESHRQLIDKLLDESLTLKNK